MQKYGSRFSSDLLFSLVLVAILVCSTKVSGAQRPISDFISQQGTYCIDDGSGGCFLFVPPAANYLGWFDPKTWIFCSFDYAGLADIAAGGAFGTELSGVIEERPLPDGRAQVSLILNARHALAWASDNFGGPPLFGHWTPDVLAGATPAFGDCSLQLKFIHSAPGAPLPDLIQLAFFTAPDQELIEMSFVGVAHGELPGGSDGVLQTRQTGLIRLYSQTNPNSRVALDGFPAEKIVIRRTGN